MWCTKIKRRASKWCPPATDTRLWRYPPATPVTGGFYACPTRRIPLLSLRALGIRCVGENNFVIEPSLHANYEHLWKWDTNLPMWSSNEDEDPWAQGTKAQPSVGFERKFTARPENLTSYRHAGNSHDPLVRPAELESLRGWLAKNFSASASSGTSSFVYEDKLPSIQERLQVRPAAR